MCKLRGIFLLMVSLLLFVQVAMAADRGVYLGLWGAASMPQNQNSFSDLYSSGMGFGGQVGGTLMNKTQIVFNASHNVYSEKMQGLEEYYLAVLQDAYAIRKLTTPIMVSSPAVSGGGLTVQQFSLNLVQPLLQSRLGVYVMAGPGLYLYRYKSVTMTATKQTTDPLTSKITTDPDGFVQPHQVKYTFAFEAGAGAEYALLSKLALFAEGKYNYTKAHNASTESYRNFISGKLGVRYHL